MQSLFQIVIHTPLWVWPLMAFVLWLGWYGRRDRVVAPAQLAILPLVGLGTSLATIVQSADPGLAIIVWLVVLAAGLPVGWLLGNRRAVRRLDDGRLELAGGWFMLGFGLSIFAVRYALGVLFGLLPALKAEPFWVAVSAGVGGVIAGIGIGWLASLLLRARRSAAMAG